MSFSGQSVLCRNGKQQSWEPYRKSKLKYDHVLHAGYLALQVSQVMTRYLVSERSRDGSSTISNAIAQYQLSSSVYE